MAWAYLCTSTSLFSRSQRSSPAQKFWFRRLYVRVFRRGLLCPLSNLLFKLRRRLELIRKQVIKSPAVKANHFSKKQEVLCDYARFYNVVYFPNSMQTWTNLKRNNEAFEARLQSRESCLRICFSINWDCVYSYKFQSKEMFLYLYKVYFKEFTC